MKRLLELKQLLKTERDDDFQQYTDVFSKNSIQYRKQKGVTWFPVSIANSEMGLGEYLIIDVERTTNHNESHQFSNGKNVTVFSNQYPDEKPINGTIKLSLKNKLKISLTVDELPDWINDGKLGVNLSFDDVSYKEMESALDKVLEADNNRIAHLRDVLYKIVPPEFNKLDYASSPDLNPSQNDAVQKIIAAKDVALVHGPPGTGKTTTLVHAIAEVLKTEQQVLVCSASNTAVDLLTEKLHRKGINVLRVGNPVRISDDVMNNTVDVKVASHETSKELKNYRKRAEEFFRMAGKYKRILGREEREQRQLLYQEAKKIIKEARELEDYILKDLFDKAQVIACTPVVSSGRMLRNRSFNTLFIDEAAQALEPMCWIPILKCNRVILAGDHFQLPPTVKSKRAEGLATTLFEQCMTIDNASVMLNVQYRMNKNIMEFSNSKFYHKDLHAHASVSDYVLNADSEDLLLNTPVAFIDTAGCGYEEKLNPESVSTSNHDEAALLLRHLKMLLAVFYKESPDKPLSVGIISPYKEQVEYLEELKSEDEELNAFPARISIKTVDGFQGQERDVIYISLVRSNDKKEIGFLSDIRRMNVAITRAKKKLVIIGDSSTLANHPFYKDFIDYAERINAYASAWEFM